MSWFFIALLAQFILGTSAVFDKLLLKKSFPNPLGYAFWLGIFGLAALVLVPFGFSFELSSYIGWALLAGAVFMAGMLCYFFALYYGEASGAGVALGAFSPIATLILSMMVFGSFLVPWEWIGFILLAGGGLLLSRIEHKETRQRVFWLVLAAAFCIGLSNVVSKIVFDQISFTTGFVWIKIGGALLATLLLIVPAWRRQILESRAKAGPYRKTWYIFNRAYAGAGSILVSYAISLGSPPLVDSMQSARFLFIFLGGWWLLGERFRGKILWGKIAAFIIISFGILILGTGGYLKQTAPDPDRHIEWGVTFSQKFSMLFDFGEDGPPSASRRIGWQDNYDAILDDLGVRHLRLIAYWDLMEPVEGTFDFSGLDYQMRRAEEVGADVVLVVGKKVPRWPECHFPIWTQKLSREDKDERVLRFVATIVERYKNSAALRYWQVENEPFLAFGEGECTLSGRDFLDKEIKLVRLHDPATPILMTDSGEIGPWFRAAKRGDVFGTTMYRRVHNDQFGNFEYPLGPGFFRIKEKFTRILIRDFEKDFLVIELGMEPWLKRQPYETTPEEQFKVFDFAFFQDSIRYAKATGFDEYYLWGVEWWYWQMVRHNNTSFWNEARKLMAQ